MISPSAPSERIGQSSCSPAFVRIEMGERGVSKSDADRVDFASAA